MVDIFSTHMSNTVSSLVSLPQVQFWMVSYGKLQSLHRMIWPKTKILTEISLNLVVQGQMVKLFWNKFACYMEKECSYLDVLEMVMVLTFAWGALCMSSRGQMVRTQDSIFRKQMTLGIHKSRTLTQSHDVDQICIVPWLHANWRGYLSTRPCTLLAM